MSSAESDRPEAPSGPGTPGGTPSGRPDPPVAARTDRPEQPAVPLLIYTALRVGLVAALTAVLAMFMPLIVALLFAIIIQLPLAWLLFAGQRRRVNEALAASSAHRRAERERLRAALAGETPDPDPGVAGH